MSHPFDRLHAALAGRYTVTSELGRGGMATVYLAEDLRHRRKVAVKVLRPLWRPRWDRSALPARSRSRPRSVAFWAMPINAGKARLLLRPQGPDIGGRAYWATSATNGKRIYFVRTERESDVFVAEVNR